MANFCERFAIIRNTTVLDMGGGAFNWTMVREPPKLTILDIYEHGDKAEWATYVVGDGCKTNFASGSFDVVFSNSVIEHEEAPRSKRTLLAHWLSC
jgi:2-polyprenyl-3-methyl-5-hydroxy-6-metoxy-1,4-benzoquinol methylase